MTSTPVLVDTSVWVEFLRGKNHEVGGTVAGLINSRRATLCGVVLSELLAGVKAKKDRDTLKHTFDALDYVEVSKSTWTLAGGISARLRAKGRPTPLTDIVVAALAIENGCEVFTFDTHFERIPEVTRFRA